jgi:hypothetical protein
MTNAFTDEHRNPPASPVALTPRAAVGGPDSEGGGGIGVDFWLKLGATLGTLAENAQAEREQRETKELPPSNEVIFRAGTFPTSGNLILDLGSVPLGRVWQVRRIVVGGVSVIQPAAGAAYMFAQGAAPSDLNITNCVDIFATLPRGNTYGTHQLFLLATEHLYVVVTGGTPGQQYGAASRVEDWHFGAFTSSFAE